jgi:hypothetical protein
MVPPPPDAPTPSTLGAVDLDPCIPKPSTREIVDHLLNEINAAKQIAEEITSVQTVLDGMMEGSKADGSLVERVTKQLEEKTRRVEELEGLLGVVREEKRVLEERIRIMEDERALKAIIPLDDKGKEIVEEIPDEGSVETMVDKEDAKPSPITSLAIPVVEVELTSPVAEPVVESTTTTVSPPASPSTAPSSPLQASSTRSVSPISLSSSESSRHDNIHLIEKIALLESQLNSANKQIEDYKTQLEQSSPILSAVTAAISSSTDFPFTFTVPTTTPTRSPKPRTPLRSRSGTSPRHRRKKPEAAETAVVSVVEEEKWSKDKNRELIEGLCAAIGVVVLGWMGMWFVNHLVERGERVVK